jgi:hypothetical protein
MERGEQLKTYTGDCSPGRTLLLEGSVSLSYSTVPIPAAMLPGRRTGGKQEFTARENPRGILENEGCHIIISKELQGRISCLALLLFQTTKHDKEK